MLFRVKHFVKITNGFLQLIGSFCPRLNDKLLDSMTRKILPLQLEKIKPKEMRLKIYFDPQMKMKMLTVLPALLCQCGQIKL